jgi:hypothetical protein
MTDPAISLQPLSVNGARRNTNAAIPPNTPLNIRTSFFRAFIGAAEIMPLV